MGSAGGRQGARDVYNVLHPNLQFRRDGKADKGGAAGDNNVHEHDSSGDASMYGDEIGRNVLEHIR
jgi:hypothetical protein